MEVLTLHFEEENLSKKLEYKEITSNLEFTPELCYVKMGKSGRQSTDNFRAFNESFWLGKQ